MLKNGDGERRLKASAAEAIGFIVWATFLGQISSRL